MPNTYQSGSRGEQTRARILRAASQIFAERGYGDTRLEDIASRVGVQRAALVYYFRDKQSIYDAVTSEATGDLIERLEAIFESDSSPAERIGAMVDTWVDTIAERPWLARLMLREMAGATPESEPAFAAHGRRMLALMEKVLAAGRRSGAFHPIDVLHLASALAGATVFFVSVMPTVAPRGSFDPLSPERLSRHRRELHAISRRLLGVEEPSGPVRRATRRGRA